MGGRGCGAGAEDEEAPGGPSSSFRPVAVRGFRGSGITFSESGFDSSWIRGCLGVPGVVGRGLLIVGSLWLGVAESTEEDWHWYRGPAGHQLLQSARYAPF